MGLNGTNPRAGSTFSSPCSWKRKGIIRNPTSNQAKTSLTEMRRKWHGHHFPLCKPQLGVEDVLASTKCITLPNSRKGNGGERKHPSSKGFAEHARHPFTFTRMVPSSHWKSPVHEERQPA